MHYITLEGMWQGVFVKLWGPLKKEKKTTEGKRFDLMLHLCAVGNVTQMTSEGARSDKESEKLTT